MQKNSENQTLMIILVIQSIIIFHFYGRFTLHKKGFHTTSTCFLSFLLFNTCAFFLKSLYILFQMPSRDFWWKRTSHFPILYFLRFSFPHTELHISASLIFWSCFAPSLDNWMWPEVHQFMWYLPSVGKVLLPVPRSVGVIACGLLVLRSVGVIACAYLCLCPVL